jgi:hypothetical protein
MNSKVEVKIGPEVEYFLRKRFGATRKRSVSSLVEAACAEIANEEMRKTVSELDAKNNVARETSA